MSPLVQRTWMEGWMDARRAGISLTSTEHLDGRDQAESRGCHRGNSGRYLYLWQSTHWAPLDTTGHQL